MADTKYTDEIRNKYKSSFPDDWISQITRQNKKQQLSDGIRKIKEFEITLISNLSKIVLSGDFFLNDYKSDLNELNTLTWQEYMPSDKKRIANLSWNEFNTLLINMRNAITLVLSHIDYATKHYEKKSEEDLYSFISYESYQPGKDQLVDILHTICDACSAEYRFSYYDTFIRELLIIRLKLLEYTDTALASEIQDIINASILKINLMLYKLSSSPNNTTNYYFKNIDFSSIENGKGKIKEFKEAFINFGDKKSWTPQQIESYQADSHGDVVALWKYVLLMRYYSKFAPRKKQVEDLFQRSEKHYSESIIQDKNKIVDNYADRSARNYMYNTKFSYHCQDDESYSFSQMKEDLRNIGIVQNETSIFNYHPYEKAFEYTYKYLLKEIEIGSDEKELDETIKFLEDCYHKFKKNVAWCKSNQPYILQLRFEYSVVDYNSIKIFCPSSFLRPLHFDILEETIIDYNSKLSAIRSRIENLKDKREILDVKEKIDSIEKDSFQRMSFFSTIIIFLVGLISIFTNNSNSVSILDKVQYTAVLGVILLLFICLAFFYTKKGSDKLKSWIFGILLIIFSAYLIITCIITSSDKRISKQRDNHNHRLMATTKLITIQTKKIPLSKTEKPSETHSWRCSKGWDVVAD